MGRPDDMWAIGVTIKRIMTLDAVGRQGVRKLLERALLGLQQHVPENRMTATELPKLLQGGGSQHYLGMVPPG